MQISLEYVHSASTENRKSLYSKYTYSIREMRLYPGANTKVDLC